jgi:hypothetical protein
MAFRQPTYHAPQRIYTAPEETQDLQRQQTNENLDESQEWILFSPGAASTTDGTFTASTQRTQRTTGRSRASHYGSLDTAAQSYGYDEDESEHTGAVAEDEEDGELDSLDSHLHEFRAEPSVYRESLREAINTSGNTVLPTHDGLGSFRMDGLGEGAQEHLYAFERYNPRRIKRRRESLELGQLELENERSDDLERTRRVEEWRMEQSRALLDEIQKETRRRKQSMSSDRRSMLHGGMEEELATMGSVVDDESSSQATAAPADENDSFWSRITRRVIQDLMGIDDRLLSILFGESLPEDDDLSTTPPATQSVALSRPSRIPVDTSDDSWENRLLERVARELGILVNQLSDHPGAFSTYMRMQEMPLPYAGLPIIPEVSQDAATELSPSTLAASMPDFKPTIQMSSQPVEIAGSRSAYATTNDVDATPRLESPIHQSLAEDDRMDFTKEEWERQLDVKMIFRYLKSRFTSQPESAPVLREKSRLATTSPQDAAARAARVRRHHPLVTRQVPADRRIIRVNVPASPILHRRGSSSCASQSTRKSARRNSGSSRHYWDINGSIGSGSLIASGGGWGEV